MSNQNIIGIESANKPWHKRILGLAVASIFSVAYLLIPAYLLSAILSLALRYPSIRFSSIYSIPLVISILTPPRHSPWALRLLKPMLDYFDFEAIHLDEINIRKQMNEGKGFIFAAQPHGVLSYVGMCSAVNNPEDVSRVPTAAASVVLQTPILKNLMGIFNLVDASSGSIKSILKDGGSVLIYIGGIAELFKSCRDEERVYLANRKGFIKLALTEGVDIVPVYLFGNTSVLSVLKHGPLAELSRKLQISLTLFWGKWMLPIPRDEKLLYVVGKPIGLPHIIEPTQKDVDKWHGVYCEEVRKIFDSYKEKVPLYKHKKLVID